MESDVVLQKAVPHEELCDRALEHYNEISDEATHYSSLVPAAIRFYKEHYVRRGERKFVYTPGKLKEALEEGWVFDPWLSSRGMPTVGGPITIDSIDEPNSPVYWVLVKGTPEQIATLEPFVELPEDEEEPEPGQVEPYGLRTELIPYDSEGKPSREPDLGYVVMHKDHVYAKGTVYTLRPGQPSVWVMSRDLAQLSGRLGVDEAHDVLVAIIKG